MPGTVATTPTTLKKLRQISNTSAPVSTRTYETNILPNTTIKMQNPLDLRPLASEVRCSEQGSETTCTKMFRDFPNSLENSRICRKVKAEGKKKEDWMSRHQAECDRSRKFYARFVAKCCGQLWCRFAASQAARWEEEANSLKCRGDSSSERRATLRCRTVNNSLKALRFLQCNV